MDSSGLGFVYADRMKFEMKSYKFEPGKNETRKTAAAAAAAAAAAHGKTWLRIWFRYLDHCHTRKPS